MPGNVTPATSSVPECRCASYHRFGIWWPRCISFDNSGLPVTVCAPETTQSFDPFTASETGCVQISVPVPLRWVTELSGRSIVPGSIHIQVGGQLRPQLSQDLLPRQSVAKGVIVQFLYHPDGNDNGVLCLPRLGSILQNAELERKAVAMRLNECVDSAGVGIEIRTVAGSRHLQRLPGRCTKSQNAF